MYSFSQFKAILHEGRVPARFPKTISAKGGDTHSADLQVDLPTMKRNRKSFEGNMDMLRDPQHYRDVDHSKIADASHDDVAEHYIHHFTKNILHNYNSMPEHRQETESHWYDGAHTVTKKKSMEYQGLPHAASAAVAALLSPQNDWDNNVALHHRVIDHWHNQQDTAWSPKMGDTAKKIWKEKDHAHLNHIMGKKLSELSNSTHQAMWIRTYDEAHNHKQHQKIDAHGNSDPNRLGTTKWQSTATVARSIDAIKSGGNLKKISSLLGSRHKVRSFYNNIIDPNSDKGDVTVDTHAVGAAHYKPFSSKSLAVNHAFGSSTGKGQVNAKTGGTKTGISGTYALYAEAYRRAAKHLSEIHGRTILPRHVQSVTWVHQREMFPQHLKKGGKFTNAVNAVWEGHHRGEYDDDHARKMVDDISSKMRAESGANQAAAKIKAAAPPKAPKMKMVKKEIA